MIYDLSKKLNLEFYKRNTLDVAQDLLNKILIHRKENIIYAGKIVKVEAYDGTIDKASHSYNRRTDRTEIMYSEGGYLYVYLTYGMHHCCNVVTGIKDKGTAVLIRAVEPLNEIEKMLKNRFNEKEISNSDIYKLTSGPGNVCKAMEINRDHSGINLSSDTIFILDNEILPLNRIKITKRIGITRSVNLPWRFYIKNNRYISKK